VSGSPHAPQALLDAAPDADLCSWAPGRANLIGEYTDVAEGFVLPVALELRTWAMGTGGGEALRVRSLDEPGAVHVDLATREGPTDGWGAYATGVVRALYDSNMAAIGFGGIIASDVPRGAGLSSSAALEVCLAMAVLPEGAGTQAGPSMTEIAVACRRAENVYVGVQSGIMDQLSSAAGVAGHALLIDCRSLEVRLVPVPDGISIVVVDSGVRRSLTDGRYNEVRRDLDEAARLLDVPALRDVSPTDLDRAIQAGRLQGSALARARHIVSENQRTLDAADALDTDDLTAVAGLFAGSHRSLRDDLRVSVPELDALVEIAGETPGVVASRMTGAGFGGCIVNLVRADGAQEAANAIVDEYQRRTGKGARAWVSAAAAGAGRQHIGA
jgi:galactokinase